MRGVLEGDKKSADMPLLTVSRIPFTSRRSISDKSQLIGDRPEMYLCRERVSGKLRVFPPFQYTALEHDLLSAMNGGFVC